MPDWLGNLIGIGGGTSLIADAYSRLGDIGQEAFERFGPGYEGQPGLAEELTGMLEFRPYTVTTGTGGQFGVEVDPVTGQATTQITMSPEEKALQEELLKQATSFYGMATTPDAEREAEVLRLMRERRAPVEEQERLELEQRLAAQGRLGTRTSMFGGTPEQLALAEAQRRAESEDILRAMEFAQAEQGRQQNIAAGLLEASYLPQGQLLAAIEPGMTAAERQRQSLSEQAQTYGETYASAINALLSSGVGQAKLLGDIGSGIAGQAARGLFG